MKTPHLTCCWLLSLAGLSLGHAAAITPKAPLDGSVNVGVANPNLVVESSVSIALGNDSCFLNGEYIEPSSVLSKMAIFKPGQLEYGTPYTLEVRDGAFCEKASGAPLQGCRLHFTTENITPRVFDAVVAQDGSGDYTSLRQAVKAAPTNRITPWTIFVKNGVYEEIVRVAANQPYLSIVGEDKEHTVLKFSITSYGGHERNNSNFPDAEGQGPVLAVNAPNFYLHNITVIDSWGYDNQAGPQALALGSYADRFAMFETKLYSYQDTWQTGADEHRHYARRCYIEGAVDFIYCSGDLLLDSCTLGLCRNGSVIVAPSHGAGVKYGYVFRDATVVSSKSGVKRTDNVFGRPWHNYPRTSFINTTLGRDVTFKSEGWINHMGGLPVVFAEYNTRDSQGRSVDLSHRNTYYWTGSDASHPENTCTAKAVLTKEEADALTLRAMMTERDGWRPDIITRELPAPVVFYRGDSLYWQADGRALCYEVLRQGRFQAFCTESGYRLPEGEPSEYTVRLVNPYGTLGLISAAPVLDAMSKPSASGIRGFFNGRSLRMEGFSGEGRLDIYSMEGRLFSRQMVGEGQEVNIPIGAAVARFYHQNQCVTVKCIRR